MTTIEWGSFAWGAAAGIILAVSIIAALAISERRIRKRELRDQATGTRQERRRLGRKLGSAAARRMRRLKDLEDGGD